jgi:hypothetical protein
VHSPDGIIVGAPVRHSESDAVAARRAVAAAAESPPGVLDFTDLYALKAGVIGLMNC